MAGFFWLVDYRLTPLPVARQRGANTEADHPYWGVKYRTPRPVARQREANT